MQEVHTRERQLEQELTTRIEERLPGTEVLAVELLGPERICVFIDHPQGVDHALCQRVTGVLDPLRRTYGIDVSSPGLERPLRTPQHFRSVVGRRVTLRTQERRRVRGQVLDADDRAVTVQTQNDVVTVPTAEIESRAESPLSMMPEGMLDALTKEQVRDLIAYLSAKSQVPLPR